MTNEERDQAISDLQAQVAALTRRLEAWDAAAERARALMAEHAAERDAATPDQPDRFDELQAQAKTTLSKLEKLQKKSRYRPRHSR